MVNFICNFSYIYRRFSLTCKHLICIIKSGLTPSPHLRGEGELHFDIQVETVAPRSTCVNQQGALVKAERSRRHGLYTPWDMRHHMPLVTGKGGPTPVLVQAIFRKRADIPLSPLVTRHPDILKERHKYKQLSEVLIRVCSVH